MLRVRWVRSGYYYIKTGTPARVQKFTIFNMGAPAVDSPARTRPPDLHIRVYVLRSIVVLTVEALAKDAQSVPPVARSITVSYVRGGMVQLRTQHVDYWYI